jgi:hypothetical protein
VYRTECGRQQEQLHVPLRHRQGWVRQGMEGGAQEGQGALRNEGNVQSPGPHQEKCQLSPQRTKNIIIAETFVIN